MDYNNKPESYYTNVRQEMLSFLPKTANKILDVGCSEGNFGLAIKEKNNAEVWGIELMEKHAIEAKKKLHKVFIGQCEDFLDNLPNNHFDAIYFNDVLEHMVDPYSVLDKMKAKLSDNGVIISSIPNLRYHRVFKELVFDKDFKYKEEGILDKTHLRFFTKKSIIRMYEDLGYKIISHVGINGEKKIRRTIFKFPDFFKIKEDMKHLQYATVASKIKNTEA